MEKASSWLAAPTSLLSAGRTSKFARVLAGVSFFLFIVLFYGLGIGHGRSAGLSRKSSTSPSRAERRLMDAAGNSTLGFDSIQFINMPGRFDRTDAAALQAFLSGIDITEVEGVDMKDRTDVGMPPEHLNRVKKGEKGCYRAHANIWSRMLHDKTPAVLILESDAAWDVNLREIMRNLNQYFSYFLHELNSKTLPNPSHAGRAQRTHRPLVLDPHDPWHSTHWDLLSFGQCFEDSRNKNTALRFPDAHVPAGKDYFGDVLGEERVARRSGGIVCTTAYAISQTGAVKLLLRGAVDLDNPIDLIMRRMIMSEDLLAYSIMPPIFGQWEYIKNIGMAERGANSDIHSGEGADAAAAVNMSGWDEVKRTGSVWQDREDHKDAAFKNMALQAAWKLVFDDSTLEASQFKESDGN